MSGPVRRRPGGAQTIPRPAVWQLGGPPPWSGRALASTDELLARIVARPFADTTATFPDARDSAVLVLLHDGHDGPEVLFTRRAGHLRNHRGEISFPGGRVDPGETFEQAAVREAFEEVALDPTLVTVHGRLDPLSTVVSRSHIVPVVASVGARPELRPSPHEVERVLWVSLAELARDDTYREESWGTSPLARSIHFFELDDETIWGATGRMLHQLLALAAGVDA